MKRDCFLIRNAKILVECAFLYTSMSEQIVEPKLEETCQILITTFLTEDSYGFSLIDDYGI